MKIERSRSFDRNVKKYKKDTRTIQRLKNQLKKIIKNPDCGNPLRGIRKGERKIYFPYFRLLYAYNKQKDTLYLLDFDHRSNIY